jgi:UPF0176 protein
MREESIWYVTAFYRFLQLEADNLIAEKAKLLDFMHSQNIRGLVILAPEGINGTVAGSPDAISEFKTYICTQFASDVHFKDSISEKAPFRRTTVDLRDEIVGLKRPDLVPDAPDNSHLTPAEWHAMLESDQPKLLIDTRNRYETQVGKFRGAIDPDLGTFSDWQTYLRETPLPKDVPVMIYCTGGIRCEKAILEMHEQGFEKVYQLRDGILGYLAEYPDGFYEGECYVFDDRVTVGPDLKPTGHYGTCPGCGLTAGITDQCVICDRDYFVCETCQPKRPNVCSKPCLDQFQRHGARRRTAVG